MQDDMYVFIVRIFCMYIHSIYKYSIIWIIAIISWLVPVQVLTLILLHSAVGTCTTDISRIRIGHLSPLQKVCSREHIKPIQI